MTDADLAALAAVDDVLATKAAARRSEALVKAAEARHRTAMGQPPVKRDRREDIAETVVATIIAQQARPRARIKALEDSTAELEARIRSLEDRILELAAKHAERDSAVPR